VVVLLFILVAVCSIAWHFRRSRSLLQRWADENGYEILESQYRNVFKGPGFWASSREQTVYHVKVKDRAGYARSGWVRFGGWFLGLWSGRTEVNWEE